MFSRRRVTEILYFTGGIQNSTSTWKTVSQLFIEVKQDLAVLFQGFYPTRMKTNFHRKTYFKMFIPALLRHLKT